MQEQLIAHLTQALQERVGLSSEQAQGVVQTGLAFAQEHSGQIIETYGPAIMQQYGPQIIEKFGPQIGQMLGEQAGGLLGGLFGSSR
jgi:hypothetical protein